MKQFREDAVRPDNYSNGPNKPMTNGNGTEPVRRLSDDPKDKGLYVVVESYSAFFKPFLKSKNGDRAK